MRALGSVRGSKRCACVSVSVWCMVYVLKPNRRQTPLLLPGQSAARRENIMLPRTFSLALGGAAR